MEAALIKTAAVVSVFLFTISFYGLLGWYLYKWIGESLKSLIVAGWAIAFLGMIIVSNSDGGYRLLDYLNVIEYIGYLLVIFGVCCSGAAIKQLGLKITGASRDRNK